MTTAKTEKLKRCYSTIEFYNGQKIPSIGLGTWQSTEEEVYNAVLVSMRSGYRHIDTAAAYGNEEAIGRAIKDSGIPREELFVTTKLWCTDHTRPKEALRASLKSLGLIYVDLYLMHWPVPLNPNGNHPKFPTLPNGNHDINKEWNFIKTYLLMQDLVKDGLTKAIGVSNFSIKNLMMLLVYPGVKIKPVVNQVEMHPYLPQSKLLEFCKENNIVIEVYSPLGSSNSPILKDETITELAKKYNISPASLLISWALWRGTVVLPKSVTPFRIEANLHVIQLQDEDGECINEISSAMGVQRFVLPNWYPAVVFNDDG